MPLLNINTAVSLIMIICLTVAQQVVLQVKMPCVATRS